MNSARPRVSQKSSSNAIAPHPRSDCHTTDSHDLYERLSLAMTTRELLSSFGSLVALPELDSSSLAAVPAPSARATSSQPLMAPNSQPFSRLEEQCLMLGASLFGARWGLIAQLAGSRTVSHRIGSIALRWQLMGHRGANLTLFPLGSLLGPRLRIQMD